MDVEKALEHIRHRLPAQAPIKDFIHHNTLHAFQNRPFDEGVQAGADFYGANAYMPLSYYRELFKKGAISRAALSNAVGGSTPLLEHALFHYIEVKDWASFRTLLSDKKIDIDKANQTVAEIVQLLGQKSIPQTKMRSRGAEHLGVNLDAAINPVLIRLISGYLDQGVGLWPFLSSELPFWQSVGKLVRESALPLASFTNKKRLAKWFELSSHEAVEALLQKIVGSAEHFEAYIEETLMAHPGWSGMVNVIEQKPSALLRPRAMYLADFLAVKLALEWELIASRNSNFVPFAQVLKRAETPTESERKRTQCQAMSLALMVLSGKNPPVSFVKEGVWEVSATSLAWIWQKAYEDTYYHQVLSGLKQHADSDRSAVALRSASPTSSMPLLQAAFCIDDRESSFRRYLEELDPRIETFATAGFFGIDVYFQSLNDAEPFQSCPVVITPKHVIKEIPAAGHHEHYALQKQGRAKDASSTWHRHSASASMLLGVVAANTLGHLSIFKLGSLLLKPLRFARTLQTQKIEIKTELTLLREQETRDGELHLGFTYDEMANRVDAVLRNMGLTGNFAPLVFLVSHGSSSVNNPHFSAYDCGACSGKPGAPNARAFAKMANDPEVRRRVLAKGLVIPEATRFVGAFHDTCVDEVSFADTEDFNEEQQRIFDSFVSTIDRARTLNAKERCRRFAVVDLKVTPDQALLEVKHRASSLFEPRPELNHATNTLAIVGRRTLTRGLFLDRRAFLNSYDPGPDQSGQILNSILNAVVPVCGGINLEYYFSRVDPGVYGCGTKLSHNVCSLIGVYNGIDDDLRTGLPVQMTEVHDPIRLLIIVEQKPDIVLGVITKNLPVLEWIDNGWVHIACIDPETHDISLYKPKMGFEPYSTDQNVLAFVRTSAEYVTSSRDNLAIAQIGVR